MIPSNLDFASEVKADRLRTLTRATLIVCVIIGWLFLTFAVLQRVGSSSGVMPFLLAIGGCLVTRWLLKNNRYVNAAWAYTLTGMAAVTGGLIFGSAELIQILSFAFPVLVFVVGLLLSPKSTLTTALVSSVLITFAPYFQVGSMEYFSVYQVAAIVLTILSALLAMQVTGDLYQVTEWALENYQRERRAAGELFDSRQELQRSLARSEALSERLQETNVQLETARTAAEDAKHFRGQFLANMSHELRTPLNAIIGFSETMLKFPAMYENIRLPDAYEADLQQIYTSGRQLLNLINDILDLSKVDAGKLDVKIERVDLNPIFNSVVSTAGGLIGTKPIRLEMDVADGLPEVWADRSRVSQVLLNIYSNAAKFTDAGVIRLTAREVNQWVQVSVTDTGSGISPENAELIFEEFKQAETGRRDPRAGAGLGLAISRQLMTLMGGHIWVESELEKGSTFHFTLRPHHEAAEDSADWQDDTAPRFEVGERLEEKVG